MTDRQKELLRKLGLDEKDFEPAEKSTAEVLDTLDAQITYTALMTDTLIEEE